MQCNFILLLTALLALACATNAECGTGGFPCCDVPKKTNYRKCQKNFACKYVVKNPSNNKRLNKRGKCVDNDEDEQWAAIACASHSKEDCYKKSYRCIWKKKKCGERIILKGD